MNTGRQLRSKKYAGSFFLRMYGDPLVGILQIQAVKAGKYAGSFLRMYEDPLVGILRIHAGSPELKICRQFFIKAILYDFELLFL